MDASSRSQQGRATETKSFYASFSDFLRKYRIAVIGAFAALIVAAAALAIFSAVNDKAAEASMGKAETLIDGYSAYISETDEAKKAELEASIAASVKEITAKWPRLFAAQRALTISARIYESKKDWASAEREWLAAAQAVPTSYLAPIALQNAAAAAEEQGSAERAIEHYKAVIEKYGDTAIGLPHAHFSIARLSEGIKDYAGAMESYQRIVSTWPDSDWTKLSMDRIIALKSRGLAK